MKIKTIKFTSALTPAIGQQFDSSDAQNIDVQLFQHCVVIDADRNGNHFRLHVPWSQIMFIREDI